MAPWWRRLIPASESDTRTSPDSCYCNSLERKSAGDVWIVLSMTNNGKLMLRPEGRLHRRNSSSNLICTNICNCYLLFGISVVAKRCIFLQMQAQYSKSFSSISFTKSLEIAFGKITFLWTLQRAFLEGENVAHSPPPPVSIRGRH